jgi:hypothetical protein
MYINILHLSRFVIPDDPGNPRNVMMPYSGCAVQCRYVYRCVYIYVFIGVCTQIYADIYKYIRM